MNPISKHLMIIPFLSFLMCCDLMARPLSVSEKAQEMEAFRQTLPLECRHETESYDMLKHCAVKTFTMNGEPISPRIIEELLIWISDREDQITSINLIGSQGTNKFFIDADSLQVSRGDKTKNVFDVDYIKKKAGIGDRQDASLSYQFHGITDNGIYVISTCECGGGSGMFQTLLLLTFEEDTGFDVSITKNKILPIKRLMLKKLCEITMGDRSAYDVKINGNKLDIWALEWPNQKIRHEMSIDLAALLEKSA